MDLTPKQQTSEAIRQAETILITTGQRPNVDQVAASLALAAILRKFGKKVSVIISDPLPGPAQWLNTKGLDTKLSGLRDFILKVKTTKVEVDSLRYEPEGDHVSIYITPFQGGFAPSDVTFDYGDYHYDLAIVLGVPQRGRIDRIYTEHSGVFEHIPLVNLDFHRSNESYGAINLVEPNASSLCEMLVATSESLQSGLIDAEIATIMLGGIMAATDRFTATHTTSKSLTVAAQMMAAGADQQAVVRGLFGDRGRDNSSRNDRAGSERSNKSDQNRDRNTAATPARQIVTERKPAEAPVIAPPAPAAIEIPQIDAAAAADWPTAPHVETVAPERAPMEQLIEPDHIELMDQADFADEPVIEELTPADPADNVPMADFTAAAEILKQREGDLPAEA